MIHNDNSYNKNNDLDNKITIHVALACDDNYAFYCAETIVSILVNTKNDNIFYHFYILQDKLLDINKERILKLKDTIKDCIIEFIDVDTTETEALKLTICYRLKLASLLPNLDKIIYTDCDVTFLDGLEEIWNENIEDYYLGAVPEWCNGLKENIYHFNIECHINKNDFNYGSMELYYNSGFIIMNLDLMRKDGIEEKFFKNFQKYPDLSLLDQDIINMVCYDKIKPISSKWNFLVSYLGAKDHKIRFKDKKLYNDFKSSIKNAKMVHFLMGRKPTTIYKSIFHPFSYRIVNRYKMKFWEYVAMTDWKDERTYRVVYKFPFGFLNKK